MKQSDFVAALKFVSHAMAIKDIRYYLNGVLFEFSGSALTLVGTDGHRMAIAELDTAPGECITTSIIVSAADVKLLLSALPAKSTGYVDFTFDNGLKITGADGRVWACKEVEGKYPDWRRAAKKSDAHSIIRPVAILEIAFNADYLATASKACAALAPRGIPGAKLSFHGMGEGAKITPTGKLPEAVTVAWVIIMPMRT